MTITKETEIGQMEVVTEFKQIQVRTDTVIKEDGVELSRSFHRHVVAPDISTENLALEHADVQAIANSGIWTQAVKDAWASKLAKDLEMNK
tara:strand:- start:529 stop:801 length:273 start_codon:yes stop_codon:yes gene_type:complete